MKKLVNKILASMLTMAMIIGMFAGVGLEAKAEVNNKVLTVKVQDKDGNPISNKTLVLEDAAENDDNIEFETNDQGIATWNVSQVMDTWYLYLEDNPTDYKEIYFDIEEGYFGESYVATVDGDAYTGEIVFEVESSGSGSTEEPTGNPEITNVSVNPTSLGATGGNVEVTVTGSHLDQIYYKRSCEYIFYGDYADRQVDNLTAKVAQATGSSTEKTFTVDLTPASNWDGDVTEWTIKVDTTETGTFEKNVKISVNGVSTPAKIVSVTASDSVSGDGGSVTVNVNGRHLGDKVYYQLRYVYGDYDAMNTYDSGEKVLDANNSFTIDIPAKSSVSTEETITGWKVRVGTSSSMTSSNAKYTGKITFSGTSEPPYDGKTLNVKVVDDNNQAISNVPLRLYCSDYDHEISNIGSTDTDGTFSYICKGNEYDATYQLMPTLNSNYTCQTPITVTFKADWNVYPTVYTISKVNGNTYNGEEITLRVQKPAPEAKITGINTVSAVKASGATITVIVQGENLPDTFDYKRFFVTEDSYGPVDNAVEYTPISESASGTNNTQKTFTVDLPSINSQNKYKDAIAWKVYVSLPGGSNYKESNNITIFNEKTLSVVVNDKSGNPVKDVQLALTCNTGCYLPLAVTDENGKTSYTVSNENNTFTLQLAAGSEYECKSPATVVIAKDGEESYIQKVNNVEFTGQEVVLEVEKAETEISSISYSLTEAKREGEPVTVTVNGKGLPEKLYYAIKYKAPTGEDFVEESVVEKAEGTFTQRTFTVNLPATSTCPTATAWRIGVNTEDPGENHTYQFARKDMFTEININIAPDTVTDETADALADAIKTAKAYVAKLNKADYTADSWNIYIGAIEAAEALVDSDSATNTACLAAIQAIDTAKAGLKKIEKPAPTPVVKKIKVTKIAVSGISKKIAAGKSIQLKASVAPSNATDKRVAWSTSNKKYATVTQSGKVTVKKAGIGKTVKITATAKDGSGKKCVYSIKIMKGVVKKVSISGNKTVKAGKTLKLKAKVTATKSANKTLKWTSSNTKYATVSKSGKVTAKKAGAGKKVKITAMATDGSGKKKTITIKIK